MDFKILTEDKEIEVLDLINLIMIQDDNFSSYSFNIPSNQGKDVIFGLNKIIRESLNRKILFNDALLILGNMILNLEMAVPYNIIIKAVETVKLMIHMNRSENYKNIFWFLRIVFETYGNPNLS